MKASDSGSKVRAARLFVRFLDDTVNFAVLVGLLLLLLFGCYSLWDSKQVYSAASSTQYELYKPGEEEGPSFHALREMNPDVIGWLTVYGTGIDYPVVQGEDNWEYLNKAADGSYNLAGSLFLGSENAADFSDYNSVIHGHHMDASAMFGDLTKFNDRKFFDEHRYGNLFANGRNYGIVFFAYSLADAYDSETYRGPIADPEAQSAYLRQLEEGAMHLISADQAAAEHILLLSTCSSDMTNGRNILMGYLTDRVYEDAFFVEEEAKPVMSVDIVEKWHEFTTVPLWIWLLGLWLLLLTVFICYNMISKKRRIKRAVRMQSLQKEGNVHEKTD